MKILKDVIESTSFSEVDSNFRYNKSKNIQWDKLNYKRCKNGYKAMWRELKNACKCYVTDPYYLNFSFITHYDHLIRIINIQNNNPYNLYCCSLITLNQLINIVVDDNINISNLILYVLYDYSFYGFREVDRDNSIIEYEKFGMEIIRKLFKE